MCLGYIQKIFEIHAQAWYARSDFLYISKASNGRQNHPKATQYRQLIKACGHPDHQLNMGMITKEIIVKSNYCYWICSKVNDCNLLIANMLCMFSNWACTGQILAGSIGSALTWFWHIKARLHWWYYPWLLSSLTMIHVQAAVSEPGEY